MIRRWFVDWWDAHVFDFFLEACVVVCVAICAGILYAIYRKGTR